MQGDLDSPKIPLGSTGMCSWTSNTFSVVISNATAILTTIYLIHSLCPVGPLALFHVQHFEPRKKCRILTTLHCFHSSPLSNFGVHNSDHFYHIFHISTLKWQPLPCSASRTEIFRKLSILKLAGVRCWIFLPQKTDSFNIWNIAKGHYQPYPARACVE